MICPRCKFDTYYPDIGVCEYCDKADEFLGDLEDIKQEIFKVSE